MPRQPAQWLSDRIMVPLPHGLFVTVDLEDAWVLDHAWYSFLGYAATSTKPPVFMHRMIAERMGISAPAIDHANLDITDNRRANLRPANKSLNGANRVKANGNFTSPYKGVSLHRASGLWSARIKVNGTQRSLGYFRDERDAARAYNAAAVEAWGEYARLNDVG